MEMDLNTQLGVLYQEFELSQAENALKITQILDLEDILYDTRILTMEDNSPCWCCLPSATDGFVSHDEACEKARQATYHLWHY